jgi:hypothetical protein
MKTITTVLALALATACGTLAAQEPASAGMTKEQQAMADAFMRMGAVRAEHERLAYFVGDWTTKNTMWMDPKAPPQTSAGTSHSEAVMGGRYIETRFEGEMQGQPFTGRGVMGFDNLAGTYFDTWYDSMSTGLFVAHGRYDAATNTYTFTGTMDDPMAPKTKVPIRAVVRIADATHYAFEWYEKRGGKEQKTMQIDYTKKS